MLIHLKDSNTVYENQWKSVKMIDSVSIDSK